MLYLAKVQKHTVSGQVGLRLLACQEAEYTWTTITENVFLPNQEATQLSEGLLVLVKISANQEVESLQDATHWVLDILQTYLTHGITPAYLQQEAEHAEQWRQSLTLQSQDLARRSLELESRREQIQALEESLKRDKESEE